MQENGLNHFGSIEEFKHAFLPLHDDCANAAQSVKQKGQQITDVEKDIQKRIDTLKADVAKINQYIDNHGPMLSESLVNQVSKQQVDEERKASTLFDTNLKNIEKLSSITNSYQLDSSVADELEKIRSDSQLQAKEIKQTFSKLRSSEEAFYQRKSVLEQQEKERQEQARLEKQRAEEAEKAAALRRKSLQKKLIWTGGFILLLVGFLKSQMV